MEMGRYWIALFNEAGDGVERERNSRMIWVIAGPL
jgi:hypothetical protein